MILPLLGVLVLLFGGAAGAWWWDHHPPIGWHTKILWKTVGFELPPSLAQQLADAQTKATSRDLDLASCAGRLAQQAAAVTVLTQQGDAITRALKDGLRAASSTVAAAGRRSAAMDFKPQGPGLCERVLDVDRHVVESRRDDNGIEPETAQ